jgi:hypothetical protein
MMLWNALRDLVRMHVRFGLYGVPGGTIASETLACFCVTHFECSHNLPQTQCMETGAILVGPRRHWPTQWKKFSVLLASST